MQRRSSIGGQGGGRRRLAIGLRIDGMRRPIVVSETVIGIQACFPFLAGGLQVTGSSIMMIMVDGLGSGRIINDNDLLGDAVLVEFAPIRFPFGSIVAGGM